ncbi:hypothetical protein [Aureimonas sp. AU12]|uniref:hypothetical protein n=1 Tax=Aureimonas sp. AU12 TaxID=1638161 RepID=UPI0007809789|nr:hypothetical protein [Aureimonas sp. AU12]
MDLTDGEREFLEGMRAITIDAGGHEIFVGLTAEESPIYLALSRRDQKGELTGTELDRFRELHARHETARGAIVDGKAPLH